MMGKNKNTQKKYAIKAIIKDRILKSPISLVKAKVEYTKKWTRNYENFRPS